MSSRPLKTVAVVAVSAVAILATWLYMQLPAIAAGGLLHPARHHVNVSLPDGCVEASVRSAGLILRGWRCAAYAKRRGTIVYLHGIADNRTSATGVIDTFRLRGFDVLAYDSRAHGESDGDVCTYGYFEKTDLRRIVDTATSGPIVLMGTSLGAAVAIQSAGEDERVSVVVAAETFSDLRTVAEERAPWFLSRSVIKRAFAAAERDGHFTVSDVSPRSSAERIRIPVLLLHGALDVDTPPAHSERVFAALMGPKRLMLVPGAHHNEALNRAGWTPVEAWIDQYVPPARD